MAYKIRQMAGLAGVSVRTLHHYDRIGLLKPESVNPAGYRLYAEHDLEKLQQILFFKELGFSLKQAGEIINNPAFDRQAALQNQRELLLKQRRRLDRIIESVEQTLVSIQGGKKMSTQEMFGPFDMSEIEAHQRKYAAETKEKYGDTAAYKESQRRASQYNAEDWARITARGNEIFTKLAALMERPVSDPGVQEWVAAWRRHISDNFYDCTPEMFKGLGEMYTADERFTKNIDKIRPGLAEYLKEGILFYCARLEDPR